MVGDPGRHVVEGAAVHADDAFVGTKLLDIGLRVAKDRLEPFVLAKPRAFSLKSSFLTSIIKKCMGEDVSRTLSLRKSNQASLESASLFWATSIPGMEGLNRSSRRGSQTSRIQKANTQTMFPGCWA